MFVKNQTETEVLNLGVVISSAPASTLISSHITHSVLRAALLLSSVVSCVRYFSFYRWNMGRSAADKLWCVKVVSGAAFLFKGGKQVANFQNIVGATVFEQPNASSSANANPTTKKLVKVIKSERLIII